MPPVSITTPGLRPCMRGFGPFQSLMDTPRFGLSAGTIAQLLAVLAQHPHVDRAVIYGSRVKGNYRPGSDIDMTLYTCVGTDIDHRELVAIADEIDDLLLPYTVDLSVFDHLSTPALREHIERLGQVLYAKSDGRLNQDDIVRRAAT